MESFIFDQKVLKYLISFVVFSGHCLTFCSGANVLIFVGLGEGSHFLASAAIGRELAQRGHNITALVSNAYSHRALDPRFSPLFHFEVFVHSRPLEEVYDTMEWVARASASGHFMWEMLTNFPDARSIEFSDCDAVFQNESLMERLVATDFDVVIADPMFCCGLLLAHHLQAKVVITSPLAWNADIGKLVGNPTNPAWIPSAGTGFPTRMTFLQRLLNVILSGAFAPSRFIVPILEEFKTQRGLVPGYSMVELYQRADLVLVQTDFAVEAPIPLMPNIVPVGGLTTRPADPLPQAR